MDPTTRIGTKNSCCVIVDHRGAAGKLNFKIVLSAKTRDIIRRTTAVAQVMSSFK
jgi:hypothetical protein